MTYFRADQGFTFPPAHRSDAERIARLEAELRYAKQIIESYELDCRNITDYLKSQPDGKGFCQGSIYREWEADMRYWSDRAAAELGR